MKMHVECWYKLSYILSSSIQIFIFSGDSMPVGIGNEILSLLLLILFQIEPSFTRKKNIVVISVFTGCSLWRSRRMWSELTGAKLQVKVGFHSHFLRIFLLSPPHSLLPPCLTIPESSQCAVLTREPLPGPPSSLSPSFHQNMLSVIFYFVF